MPAKDGAKCRPRRPATLYCNGSGASSKASNGVAQVLSSFVVTEGLPEARAWALRRTRFSRSAAASFRFVSCRASDFAAAFSDFGAFMVCGPIALYSGRCHLRHRRPCGTQSGGRPHSSVVEHSLGKGEVESSSLSVGTTQTAKIRRFRANHPVQEFLNLPCSS